ncbi:MAG: pantetheine-phosphate adenylyltransferase [Rikenellaceae bacterium]|jgi:pantetheine-phosphate adenylyltransferase|nr:pantetheine-phosphate adenylyltransferase [Rikenellaceae bacterium]
MKKTAIFPGSFDPYTMGHKSVVDQGLSLFDRVIVAIGINVEKRGLLTPENRVALIRDLYHDEPRVEVITYEGLTADLARRLGTPFLLRGMRNTVDFEFERNMMQLNQALNPELTTVLLFTPPEYVAISSSSVREIIAFGGDVSSFMPPGIDLKKYI